MGEIIAALRQGDHKRLDVIADRWGIPTKDVAGILLEEAIRHETGFRLVTSALAPCLAPPTTTLDG